MPPKLRNYLVNSIIVGGGFSLLNGFFFRFQEEVKDLIENNPSFNEKFDVAFRKNFNFIH